jgi:hypothetical protein
MGEQSIDKPREMPLMERVKAYLPLFTVLSAIVALFTFIGLKPEKEKELEWEYLSRNSLVNSSAAETDKIRVSFDGRPIRQLTVISARLNNSGDLPIASNDINDGRYPTVKFNDTVTVIAAEIKMQNPADVVAHLFVDANKITVNHGLLNPGDWIGVQILVEGDPGDVSQLPAATARISGITSLTTRYPAPTTKNVGVAYFQFSRLTEIFLLILASMVPSIALIYVVMAIHSELGQYLSAKKAAINVRMITNNYAEERQMTESERERLGTKFQDAIPFPWRMAITKLVDTAPIRDGETIAEFLKRIEPSLLRETPKNFIGRLRVLDSGAVSGVALITLVTVPITLLLVGAWYRVLNP